MRIVLDTNCLLVALPRKSESRWLYEAIRDGIIELAVTEDILKEYEEQIGDFYSPHTADLVINILLTASNVLRSEPFTRWQLITEDPDDNKFADLAISANVNYLVTNDHHFDVLKQLPFPTVKVISLDEFKEIMAY